MTIIVEAWALDLVRVIHDFSPIRKWLLKLVLGKYAYRELVGLRDALEADGLNIRIGYELENCNYHKKKVKTMSKDQIDTIYEELIERIKPNKFTLICGIPFDMNDFRHVLIAAYYVGQLALMEEEIQHLDERATKIFSGKKKEVKP